MKKRNLKKAIKSNTQRFFKKTFYRVLGKLVDIVILFGVGYAFGLKLVRY